MVLTLICLVIIYLRLFVLYCLCRKQEVVETRREGRKVYEIHTGVYKRPRCVNFLCCTTDDD